MQYVIRKDDEWDGCSMKRVLDANRMSVDQRSGVFHYASQETVMYEYLCKLCDNEWLSDGPDRHTIYIIFLFLL